MWVCACAHASACVCMWKGICIMQRLLTICIYSLLVHIYMYKHAYRLNLWILSKRAGCALFYASGSGCQVVAVRENYAQLNPSLWLRKHRTPPDAVRGRQKTSAKSVASSIGCMHAHQRSSSILFSSISSLPLTLSTNVSKRNTVWSGKRNLDSRETAQVPETQIALIFLFLLVFHEHV